MSADSTGRPSAEPPRLEPRQCAKCGAANYSYASHCFLCKSRLGETQYSNPYEAGARALQPDHGPRGCSPAQSRVEKVSLSLLIAVLLLVLCVGVGLFRQDRGVLTMYMMFVVPALAATVCSGLISVAKGEAPKASRLFLTFAFSVAITVGISVLLMIAGVVLLLVMCAAWGSGLSGPL